LIRTLLTLAVLACAGSAQAADLCVKAGGSDATAKASIVYVAGNEAGSTCWETIGRSAWGSTDRTMTVGAQAAAAGDTVYIFTGPYTHPAGTGENFDPYYNPVNSGTMGNPIVFRAVPDGTVTLCATDLELFNDDPDGNQGPTLGVNNRDWITIGPGFLLDEACAPTRPDMGPVSITDATGIVFTGNTLVGNEDEDAWWGDNHPAIRAQTADQITVSQNIISGFYNTAADDPEDAPCLETYTTDEILVEHNTCFDSGGGINFKGNTASPDTRIIRFNLIYGVSTGIVIQNNGADADGETLVYQNIVRDCVAAPTGAGEVTLGIGVHGYGLGSDPQNLYFVNNTIEDCHDGVGSANFFLNGGLIADANIKWWNNISVDSQFMIYCDNGCGTSDVQDQAAFDAEHNLYLTFETFANDGSNRTFATWTSGGYAQDATSPASTSTTDPLFVNQATNDLHLQGGSTALTLGRTLTLIHGSSGEVVPAGAYITGDETIGAGGSEEEEASETPKRLPRPLQRLIAALMVPPMLHAPAP